MGRKTSTRLSILLAAAFVLAVLLSLAFPTPRGYVEISARPVDEELILSGGDEAEAALELLPGELVDINSADELELQKLPGIGPVLAAAIVAYRQENGQFQRLEDIMEVSGIGQARFAAIEDNITLGEKAP